MILTLLAKDALRSYEIAMTDLCNAMVESSKLFGHHEDVMKKCIKEFEEKASSNSPGKVAQFLSKLEEVNSIHCLTLIMRRLANTYIVNQMLFVIGFETEV
jgi:hypothetical protein